MTKAAASTIDPAETAAPVMPAFELDPVTGLPVGLPAPSGPALRPARVRMEGRYAHVVPLEGAHAGELYAGSHGEGSAALWAYLFPEPFPDAEAFERHIAAAVVSEDPLFFSILAADSARVLGHATYMRITPEHRVIEVGNILYTPALQHTRAATEAMYLMARYVFEELGYRRYEWKCNALNAPSRRAALRLGFTFEGIFRAHMIVKGRNRDTAWYAMLDSEWPERKAAFERWLAPSNFDADGRQKLRLGAR
jgi:RimJ/RimL family protein N-acetyltransferase